MRGIILAAGMGTRLLPLTKDKPKILLPLRGKKTLLEFQLEFMEKSDVFDEIIYIMGYKSEKIEEKIRKISKNFSFDISTIFNPFYKVSNNLASLWIAKNLMDSNFMVTNGDNIIKSIVFNKLSKQKKAIYLTVVKKKKYDDDDMKVIFKREKIISVSKKIPVSKANGESIGLSLIKGKTNISLYKGVLEDLLHNPVYLNTFWLEVYNELSRRTKHANPFFIESGLWQEVDFHTDLNFARELIKNYQKIIS